MPAPAETQAATIRAFIEGWKTRSIDGWTSTWTEECTHTMLPFSMKHPGWPKEEVRNVHLPRLLSTLSNWELIVSEVVHDVAQGKACIYATSTADTPFGEFKWASESALFLTLAEDGKKIAQIQEFVDTAFFTEFAKQGAAYQIAQANKD